MSIRDDFMAHLRGSTDYNRSEYLKHISIVSVAGLGFNVIESRSHTWDSLTWTWKLSSGGFLLTTFLVIVMFNLISTRAEALLYANDPGVGVKQKRLSLAQADWLGWVARRLSIGIFAIFTLALLCAILSAMS